jgi:DNA primase
MDPVAEIKSRLDPAEYIGRSTRLQKAGRNFRGLCPFHTEKTPSFYVFPDRGTWRCFGSCGEGGDIFSFVQKRDNVDFRDAMRVLAAEAGVQLTAESPQKRSRREKLAAIVSAAVDYYQRGLASPEGAAAREYLTEKRGLRQEAIDAFRIGWAPDEWRGLRDYLEGRGYDEADILDSGLLVESESGSQPYDRFRGRITIPIADDRGIFIGMGGRGLHGEEPKYLNSPQSELFDKGRTLFGLHVAGPAIREAGTVVVVEGYMDVIGPWQAGFKNVVATMGTSLTEQHAAILRRYAHRVVLAMDPDAAGLAAAERAGGLFIALDSPENMAQSARSADAFVANTELELRVAPLPAGKDPDEVARDDPAGWANAIDNASTYAEFLLRRIMGGETPESPLEARRLVDRLKPVLIAVRDPVERGMYIQRVAAHLGVREQDIAERIRQRAPVGRREPMRRERGQLVDPTTEEYLLVILLHHPELRGDLRILPPTIFSNALDRELFNAWMAGNDFDEPPGEDPVAMHGARLKASRFAPLTPEMARKETQNKIRFILRERAIQHQLAITEQVAEAERVLGTRAVMEAANEAWMSALPTDRVTELAETVIEQMELGLSIHRREEFGRA